MELDNLNLDDPFEFEVAKVWTYRLLTSMKTGGKWIVPRSMSTYIVVHGPKMLVKVSGSPEPSITRVVTAIGWEVVDVADVEENIL